MWPRFRNTCPSSLHFVTRELSMQDMIKPGAAASAFKSMPETLVKIDLTRSAYENDTVHNRWHPDVPIVAWVNPGDDFIIETYDWTGGFIKNNDSADDVRDIDPSIVDFRSRR